MKMMQKIPCYTNEEERAIMIQKIYAKTQRQLLELQKKEKEKRTEK